MPRTSSRVLISATALAVAVAPALVAPSAAAAASKQQRPVSIALETGSLPEGIAAGPGTTFFVGARSDGDIYVGDVRDGEVTRLVDNDAPAAAVGMYYDDRTGLLWVAGGGPAIDTGTGTITAYDGADQVFQVTVDGAGFLNDVVVTRTAVYVTDSFRTELVVIPLDRSGQPVDTGSRLALTGEYEQPGGFGANGIRELPGGDLVVVSGGELYRVEPSTGVAEEIEVSGRPLEGGDGLLIRGSTLYVVNGYGGDEVVVLRLSGQKDIARTIGVLTERDTPGELDRPTTGALVAGALYVVNGRFSVAGPTTENFVTRLPKR